MFNKNNERRDRMNTDSREACECKENDIAEITAEINEMMPDEENLYDLAELFKVFGDSTRIQILYTLLDHEKVLVTSQKSLE